MIADQERGGLVAELVPPLLINSPAHEPSHQLRHRRCAAAPQQPAPASSEECWIASMSAVIWSQLVVSGCPEPLSRFRIPLKVIL
jgi:hypothetical protein